VQFVEMLDQYHCNEDIECKYSFNNYKVQDGDRIAIFKMGWKSLRNYVLFEWAVDSPRADVNSVIFSRYDLPNTQNETDDLYQFCYISGENVVQGISTPFQICSVESKPTVVLTEASAGSDKCVHLKQLLSLRDKEIIKLKEENAILRESLKSVINQRKLQQSKNYDEEINSLKELTNSLRTAVIAQQKEIDSMKIEMKKDKAAYKDLQLEKIIAEKKFEAISKKEATTVKRVCNFDLGSLQSFPAFPFETLDK
ncbi:calcium-binding and coiled-coil domain-containing protein 2, partial [Asbolus verrucosus]